MMDIQWHMSLQDTALYFAASSLTIAALILVICMLGSEEWDWVLRSPSVIVTKPQEVLMQLLHIPYKVELSHSGQFVCSSDLQTADLHLYRKVPVQIFYQDFLSTGFHPDRLSYTDDVKHEKHIIHSGERFVVPLCIYTDYSENHWRTHYPLVIVMTSIHQATLLCILHTGDKSLPKPYFIARFLRPSGENAITHRLMNLYKEKSIDSVGSEECSVCLTSSPSCALLPCRHQCVCRECVRKLDSCPICRTTIISYFTTHIPER